MTCIIMIECSSSSVAQQVVADVEAGELWGVDMGTTSKAASYSNWALVESNRTRNYALYQSLPEGDKFQVPFSTTDCISFTHSELESKIWFLRGMLGE